MQSTQMLQALQALRAQFEQPPSDMELIRRALSEQVARSAGVEMPPILNEEQRQVFLGRLNELTAFLESEDGADAIELLINAFENFSAPTSEE